MFGKDVDNDIVASFLRHSVYILLCLFLLCNLTMDIAHLHSVITVYGVTLNDRRSHTVQLCLTIHSVYMGFFHLQCLL